MNDLFGSWRDLLAVGWFLASWILYSAYVQRVSWHRHSLSGAMRAHRIDWMRQMMARENRMTDSSIIANLERNVYLLSSSALLIVAGLMTAIAGTDRAVNILASIPFTTPASREFWEVKALLLMVVFIYAFFQFTWSMRQYSFLSILIGGAPAPGTHGNRDGDDAAREAYVKRSAEIAALAAFSSNQGLRAYYFALAILGWLVNWLVFAVATTVVIAILYRREFHSDAVKALRESDAS